MILKASLDSAPPVSRTVHCPVPMEYSTNTQPEHPGASPLFLRHCWFLPPSLCPSWSLCLKCHFAASSTSVTKIFQGSPEGQALQETTPNLQPARGPGATNHLVPQLGFLNPLPGRQGLPSLTLGAWAGHTVSAPDPGGEGGGGGAQPAPQPYTLQRRGPVFDPAASAPQT